MKVLVTGAKGFVGKNLIANLSLDENYEIFEYDIDTDPGLLDKYTKECEFVFHLAGVNRPKDEEEFMKGNFGFTSTLLDKLKENGNKAPVLITSSIQAALDNPYGISKKAGEDLIFSYGKENGVEVFIYRMPNVFGKWCRPNYNSAVATFCHNIARGLPITVNDPNHQMSLVYIDDVVAEITRASKGRANKNKEDNLCYIEPVYSITLGKIVELLEKYKASSKTLDVPSNEHPIERALFATYLSYLPEEEMVYDLKMNVDQRGSFTEIIRTMNCGQFSVNVAKPGITKGNHWHNTKNEKFLVVSGEGIIRLRKIDEDKTYEFRVCGEKLQVVSMLPGYTHNIENVGTDDLVTFMWCNECFDPENPDTFFLKV